MRWLVVLTWVLLGGGLVNAQTATPDFSEVIYATLTGGEVTRFDYVTTASDVHTANLLTLIVISVWAMFIFFVLVVWKSRKGKGQK